MRRNGQNELDGGLLIFGIMAGLLIGGLVALFTVPKSGRAFRQSVGETGQNLRSTLEDALPSDPIAESLAEGKAAARRRMVELNS
ncbi:MAG TPA: YtxH domain-containing protein [Phototrophicaceae bacterium]|nr:YtxH domain-containing protein [Phototrophicaceae bacterium]